MKTAGDFGLDILAMQKVRRTLSGMRTFDNDSLMGWSLVWSGHKQKHEHGVGILFAPHVRLECHLPARIIFTTVKGMSLSILNVYALTESTKSSSTKCAFYLALSNTKAELDKNPKFKLVTLDFNATISMSNGDWSFAMPYSTITTLIKL